VRIHEGDYAYDLEPQRDPNTQLLTGWSFRVFQLRPFERVLGSGRGVTKEEAESKARQQLRYLQNHGREKIA